MPATKIETGVQIELKRLILSPTARKHRPEKTVTIAKSLKDLNQQLQDIIVCPQDETAGQASPFFDVLAGGGRKEAEESLGWEKGRCTIMYGLSPYEKLKVMLDENKEREDPSPLDEARIYKAMKESEPALKQEELAERLGISQERLSQYLALTRLPAEVQDFIGRPINLGMEHLMQICRLKTPEDQIAMAQEADQKELTVRELKTLVDQKLKGKTPKYDPWADLKAQQNKDPYVGAWPALLDQVRVSGINGDWNVKFESGSWRFQVRSSHIQKQEDLSQWFLDMGKGLGASPAIPAAPPQGQGPVVTAEPAALPSNSSEVGRTSAPVTQGAQVPAAPPNRKAPRPAPKPPPKENPLLEGLDPATRALVEAEIKKGPLI